MPLEREGIYRRDAVLIFTWARLGVYTYVPVILALRDHRIPENHRARYGPTPAWGGGEEKRGEIERAFIFLRGEKKKKKKRKKKASQRNAHRIYYARWSSVMRDRANWKLSVSRIYRRTLLSCLRKRHPVLNMRIVLPARAWIPLDRVDLKTPELFTLLCRDDYMSFATSAD